MDFSVYVSVVCRCERDDLSGRIAFLSFYRRISPVYFVTPCVVGTIAVDYVSSSRAFITFLCLCLSVIGDLLFFFLFTASVSAARKNSCSSVLIPRVCRSFWRDGSLSNVHALALLPPETIRLFILHKEFGHRRRCMLVC